MRELAPPERDPKAERLFLNTSLASLGEVSINGDKKPLFDSPFTSDSLLTKKWLIYRPEELPRTEYTDKDVADRLASPDGYTDGSIFDGPISDAGVRTGLGRLSSSWGRGPKPYGIEEREDRMRHLDAISPIRKAYAGPVYLQGHNPTCNSWTSIHALLASGITPSVTAAKELLNSALPRDNGEKGMGPFLAAAIIETHNESDITISFPPVISGFRRSAVHQVANIVKDAIDSNGAILATVESLLPDEDGKPSCHAICIAGYNINEQGHMDIQVIDSACGVGALTIEGLTRELDRGLLVPVTVVKPTRQP